MENKIEFNWEKYQSGLYDVVTRDGIKVEQLHFNSFCIHPIVGNIDTEREHWQENGKYFEYLGTSKNDLFLIPKEKENCDTILLEIGHCILDAENVGDVVIPKLKGILMEVSDEEDFEETSQELIIGTLNGLFISNTLESWGYARPIKEEKEAWVNVYEDVKGVIYCGDSFRTKEEAMKYSSNQAKYIKTIRITNSLYGI